MRPMTRIRPCYSSTQTQASVGATVVALFADYGLNQGSGNTLTVDSATPQASATA
jgi:hypothetical protein